MDVKHTTIDKESVRREAAFILDLIHKNNSKPQDHMSTAAAPAPNVESAVVHDEESKDTLAPRASAAATNGQATKDHSSQASFMGIPPELRLYIYEALWQPTKRKYTIHSDTPDGRISDRVIERAEEDKNETRTALLRVNKQICQEAAAILQSTSDLTMDTDGIILRRSCASSLALTVRANIKSIRLRVLQPKRQNATPSPVPALFFTHDCYPKVENVQLLVHMGSNATWTQRSATVTQFVLGFFKSHNLKAVAIEFSYNFSLEQRLLYSDSRSPCFGQCQKLCEGLQCTLLEDYRLKGRKDVTIDVLWRCTKISKIPEDD